MYSRIQCPTGCVLFGARQDAIFSLYWAISLRSISFLWITVIFEFHIGISSSRRERLFSIKIASHGKRLLRYIFDDQWKHCSRAQSRNHRRRVCAATCPRSRGEFWRETTPHRLDKNNLVARLLFGFTSRTSFKYFSHSRREIHPNIGIYNTVWPYYFYVMQHYFPHELRRKGATGIQIRLIYPVTNIILLGDRRPYSEMEISQRWWSSSYTAPRYRLFARGFNSVLPAHGQACIRVHAGHRDVYRLIPFADSYLHGTALFFYYLNKQHDVKKIS